MKKITEKLVVLFVVCAFIFSACSNGNKDSSNDDGSDTNGTNTVSPTGGEEPAGRAEVTGKIGKYGSPYEVGDIIFNDGSAIPYVTGLELTNEQKTASIAIIFYKGTGLNSDVFGGDGEGSVVWTTGSTTTRRTLGVGLKHGTSLAWCLDSAGAYSKNIKTIQCLNEGTAGAFIFTGDKDGSNNLEQIKVWDDVTDTTGEGAEDKYPAFYFAKDYCRQILEGEGQSRLEASGLENGWYLPSVAELYQIYACRADTTNGFDIDAASALCGGDQFETSAYWSSSQYNSNDNWARLFNFDDGWPTNLKKENCSGYFGATHVCAIREFN